MEILDEIDGLEKSRRKMRNWKNLVKLSNKNIDKYWKNMKNQTILGTN